jgi:hypothetical protein
MNELAVTLAYKYVAVMLMLFEVNHCGERLGLKGLPVQQEQIRRVYVGQPRLLKCLGCIDTETYSFGFSEAGRLRYITRLDPFGSDPLPQIQQRLSKIDAGMTTNAAYALATNWLAAVFIDVDALESKFPPVIRQHTFRSGEKGRVLLPIFDVLWGKPERPAVIVSIYAPRRELLQLRQQNEAFSRRPPGLVRSPEKLLAIPDSEFAQFDGERRQALVSEYRAEIVSKESGVSKREP